MDNGPLRRIGRNDHYDVAFDAPFQIAQRGCDSEGFSGRDPRGPERNGRQRRQPGRIVPQYVAGNLSVAGRVRREMEDKIDAPLRVALGWHCIVVHAGSTKKGDNIRDGGVPTFLFGDCDTEGT